MDNLFFKRLLAYIIDTFIIVLIMSLVTMNFANKKHINYLQDEFLNVQKEFLKTNINKHEYIEKSKGFIIEIDKENYPILIIETLVVLVYFGIFQYYNQNRTLGKQLMKIKIKSKNNYNVFKSIIRAIVSQTLFISFIILIFVNYMNSTQYFYLKNALQATSVIIFVISVTLIMFKGNALHDYIFSTKIESEE